MSNSFEQINIGSGASGVYFMFPGRISTLIAKIEC